MHGTRRTAPFEGVFEAFRQCCFQTVLLEWVHCSVLNFLCSCALSLALTEVTDGAQYFTAGYLSRAAAFLALTYERAGWCHPCCPFLPIAWEVFLEFSICAISCCRLQLHCQALASLCLLSTDKCLLLRPCVPILCCANSVAFDRERCLA